MTEIKTENLPLTGGGELRITVGRPENAVRGGLVVLHEARGVTDAVRHLVSSLASEGWLTVAPHLYYRDGADELDAADAPGVRAQVSKLSGDDVLADTDAAFSWLADEGVHPDQLGVVGFDLGGSVALVVAASRTLGAAVTVAGGGILSPLSEGLPSLVDVAGELTCPWLGIYADGDESIPVEDVEKLRDAAAGSGVATEVVRFASSQHRFDTDKDDSAEAWQRTLNWLDSHLR